MNTYSNIFIFIVCLMTLSKNLKYKPTTLPKGLYHASWKNSVCGTYMIMYMLQIIHVDHLQCFHGFQSERLSLMMYMSSMAGPFNLQSFSIMLILCEFWCFGMSPLWYGNMVIWY